MLPTQLPYEKPPFLGGDGVSDSFGLRSVQAEGQHLNSGSFILLQR